MNQCECNHLECIKIVKYLIESNTVFLEQLLDLIKDIVEKRKVSILKISGMFKDENI